MMHRTSCAGRIGSIAAMVFLVLGWAAGGPGTPVGEAQTAIRKGVEQAAPSRTPRPESQLTLPVFYGLYAVEDAQSVELKKGEEPLSFEQDVEFLFFHKQVGQDVGSWTIRKLRFDFNRGDWLKKSEETVECRLRPVAGQPEMVRIIPERILEPGAYGMDGPRTVRFFVDVDRMKQALIQSARDAMERKAWSEAEKSALQAFRIDPVDPTVETLRREIAERSERMVRIPAGEFPMGSETGLEDESPVHRVYLERFFIDKYEVTQKEFQSVMGKNPSKVQGEDLPVENVTWYEAADYCQRLGKRLPTEAEWEKAARAGTQTQFYWGDRMDESHAWYSQNSQRTIHPVGQKKPNAYHLYDTAGNVWEWVADWFDPDYYKFGPSLNPEGPPEGTYKVLRGGSAYDVANYLRPTYRNLTAPGINSLAYGFRCVK